MNKTIAILAAALMCLGGTLLAQRISVTEPHSGVIWYHGASYTIRWNISPAPAPGTTVDIYLLQAGRWIKDIARGHGTAAAGELNWRVPTDTPIGTSQVQVVMLGSGISGNSDPFTIAAIAEIHRPAAYMLSRIKVISPNGSETITSTLLEVSFSYSSGGDRRSRNFQVFLDLYRLESGRMVVAASYEINRAYTCSASVSIIHTQKYPTSGCPSGTYKVRVESPSPYRIWDESDNFFTIVH